MRDSHQNEGDNFFIKVKQDFAHTYSQLEKLQKKDWERGAMSG